MSGLRTVFLDSDLFILFAGCNLLAPLLKELGCSDEDARRLDPLPFMLQKGELYRKYPRGIRDKAAAWCETIPSLKRSPPRDIFDSLVDLPEVEAGEALLLSIASTIDHSIVVSGDKRASTAIAKALRGSENLARLRGRILHLEGALQILLDQMGFKELSSCLVAVREYNATVRILLPEGSNTKEAHFQEGLDSYNHDVSQSIKGLAFKLPRT